jgi:hypothetical protein
MTPMEQYLENVRIRMMKAVYKKIGLQHRISADGTWAVIVKPEVRKIYDNGPFVVTEYWPDQNKFSAVGRNAYPKEALVIVVAPEKYRKYL